MLPRLSLPLSDKVKHYIAIALHTIKRQPYGSCQLPITRLQNMIISYNKIQYHVLTISHHNMPCKNKLDVLYFVVDPSILHVQNCLTPIVCEHRVYHTRSSRGVSTRRTIATVHTQGEHYLSAYARLVKFNPSILHVQNWLAPIVCERRAYHTRSSRGASKQRTFATVHSWGEHFLEIIIRDHLTYYRRSKQIRCKT